MHEPNKVKVEDSPKNVTKLSATYTLSQENRLQFNIETLAGMHHASSFVHFQMVEKVFNVKCHSTGILYGSTESRRQIYTRFFSFIRTIL